MPSVVKSAGWSGCGTPDGTITVLTGKIEMGQGARAELTQAAAEEMRAPAGISISFLPDLTILRTCSANMKTGDIGVLQKMPKI